MNNNQLYIRHLSAVESNAIVCWIIGQDEAGNGFETAQATSTRTSMESKLSIGGLQEDDAASLTEWVESEPEGMFEYACICSTAYGFED